MCGGGCVAVGGWVDGCVGVRGCVWVCVGVAVCVYMHTCRTCNHSPAYHLV